MLDLDKKLKYPVLFLDDWPQPINGLHEEDDYEQPGMSNTKRWRLQTLLARNPFGIPSLAFAEAYEKVYDRKLDFQDLGFENLSEMVSKLDDIFLVQEPDELTAMLFPDYAYDKILLDARIGQQFSEICSTIGGHESTDPDTVNSHAWINRDDEFPPEVVLAGEQYTDNILPMTTANIPGTRGVHQAILVGAASPNNFYVQIKNDLLGRVSSLSVEVSQHFKECQEPIEMYSIPAEFIYKGFPCLVYIVEDDCYERCEIIGRSTHSNRIIVETVDYGGTHTVDLINLYLMPRKFFDFPKQGILVSLAGIKPADGSQRWSSSIGKRMRCFSNPFYYLDCLLLEPKRTPYKVVVEETKALESPDQTNVSLPKKKKKWQKKPQFEVLICDRNDEDLNIYMDEILCLETYGTWDKSRVDEINNFRKLLNSALEKIPRPENPMK